MVKTAIQKTFGLLPYGNRWNELAQHYITHSLDLEPQGEFRDKLEACGRHTNYFQTFAGRSIEGARIFELGTGWFAIIPIGMYLQGAAEIWTWDIIGHLRKDTFKRTLELFIQFDESGLLRQFLPDLKQERVKRLYEVAANTQRLNPRQLLEQLDIHALIGDARQSNIDSHSIDFVFSHQVLEHLSRQHIASMLAEFRRLLHDSGVTCHHIGLADQFASFDATITPFNFLKYSRLQWKLFDNSIIPQNRLRISDYRKIFAEAGFRIDAEDNLMGDPKDLRSIQLAQEFRSYSFDELLVLYSWMVASIA